MRNEAEDTIERYFYMDENIMNFYGKKTVAQEVADYLSYGNRLFDDRPDMAILCNGSCLAIEHFEFDSSQNCKNRGSKNKSEQARIERHFQEVTLSTTGILVHDEIQGKFSYEQWIKNVSTVFENHYTKIDYYKKNLIDRGFVDYSTPMKMAFLIEDTSPLGTIVHDNRGQHPVVLALSREFLKLMRNSPKIDFVIACSSAGTNKFIWLISKETLDEYDKNSVDYASMNFIDCTPKVLSYTIEVPREYIEQK